MNEHKTSPTVEIADTLPPSQSNPSHRILMVEDDSNIRHVNTEVLIRNGYHVDAAKDGELAWKALTTGSYDLMITDNRMPKVTGIELLKKIHEVGMPLSVIMATGVLPESEFRQHPELTPAATLLKPYTVPELLRVVRAVLHAADNPDEPVVTRQYGQGHPLPNHLPL